MNSEFAKRTLVSGFIVAWYILPIQMGAFYWVINQNIVACCMYNELGADSLKDWLIYLVLLFGQLGQIINRTILHKAGYKRNDHLWLHYCLYDYNTVICSTAFVLLFVWYTM